MYYRFDVIRFAYQLLPPILRGQVLVALLRILVMPISVLQGQFLAYRNRVNERLRVSVTVQGLEKLLNDALFLTDHQIHITTPPQQTPSYYYMKHEGRTGIYVGASGGPFLRMSDHYAVPTSETFVVHLPTFLSDENKGVITNLLNQYKPAGRSFRIETYDYE